MRADFISEEGSELRSKYMYSNSTPNENEATTSSTSHSQSASAAMLEHSSASLPTTDVAAFNGDEGIGASGVTCPPQVSEVIQTVPPQPVALPSFPSQQPITTFQSPGAGPGSLESPQFVASQTILRPPAPVESVRNQSVIIPPNVSESPLVTPLVVAPCKTVTPDQVIVFPMATKPPSFPPPPILGSSPVVIPNNSAVPSAVTESPATHHPAEYPQPVTLDQAAVSSTAAGPPLAPPSHVLGPSQIAAPHRAATLPVVAMPPSPVVESPPDVVHKPQAVIPPHTSDLVRGVTGRNSGATVPNKSKGVYKLRGKANSTTTTKTRRDSIEGAPEIILSLSESGYELVERSSQQGPLVTSTENGADISMNSSTTPSPEEFVVPSLQQSLEEPPTIPTETDASVPTTPSVDEFSVPSSQQSLEETLSIPAQPATTTAPRVIPNYTIDRSDLPSWLLERERLDFVLAVEAGNTWKNLITTWLRQERRVNFGLKEGVVSGRFFRPL